MGLNLALNLQDDGHEVVGWNRSTEKREQAREQGLHTVDEITEGLAALADEERRVIWLMISAGTGIDDFLFGEEGISQLLREGDIVIDGANSFYRHSQDRAAMLQDQGVSLLDCGISGGIEGARYGASIMAGGDKAAFDYVAPLLEAAAADNGYGYFGESGAGHFVKMVHNGIEYGMMQAIAEGMNIISHSEFDEIDHKKLTEVWNNGSIIESNLLGFLNSALQKDNSLGHVEPVIGSLGTGRWTVEAALQMGVSVPTIASAVFARYDSRGESSYAHRVVQALRAEFGGHSSTERPSN